MKKHLFLQGEIALGKSTLLRETILPYLADVGGFFVQRVFKGKEHVAFQLNPLDNAENYHLNTYVEQMPPPENLFLYCREGHKWYTQLAVFEQKGVKYLQRSQETNKKLILMDEIGGIELHCPLFMQTVLQILAGPQPVLGVLKAPHNAKRLNSRLAEPGKRVENIGKALAAINGHPQIELLEFKRNSYNEIKAKVEAYVKKALLPEI